MRENLAKHHVKDREEIIEEKRKLS